MKTILPVLALGASLCALNAYADDTAITIYSKAQPGAVDPNMYRPVNGQQPGYYGAGVPGYAIVRQTREVELPQKESVVKFSDVAALIDPTTVQFKSLTDPKGTKVAEQDYQFDLVSQQKLLEKYLDKNISVDTIAGDKIDTTQGTLLSTQGALVLKTADGSLRSINNYAGIHFPDLPGGLITRPTLVWDIITGKPGMQKTEVSYETQGITWWADYNLTYKEGRDANSGTVDVSSWVSIINQTGATFKNAKLKLVAGDVQRAQAQSLGRVYEAKPMNMAMVGAPVPSFAEKSFFEYHLYTLNRPVTLPDNATKQMELIPAVSDVPVEKELVYNGSNISYWGGVYTDRGYGLDESNKKVDVYLRLKNTKENGMGVSLPAGRIRVNQRDDDGSLEFIGESVIDHMPRNEDVLIKLGSAFDVVGERKQLDYTLDSARSTAQEEIEVKIRNQKKQPVKVKVIEPMYRATGWQILESSKDYKKEDAHHISYLVSVDPEKEQVIRYKVRYSW